MTYNGWSNFATWCAMATLENDEATYHALNDLTRDACRHADADEAVARLAERLDETFSAPDDIDDTLTSALTTWAYGQIDWYEIAKDLVAEHFQTN